MISPVLMAAFRPRGGWLGRDVSAGAAWTSLPMVARILATVALTPILARILTPRDYGIVALAALVSEAAALFGETGFHAALIQRKRIHRIELDTAFWTELAIGIALGAIVALMAPYVARLLDTPELSNLLLLSALTFVVGAMSSVHNTLIMRAMAFPRVARIELCAVALRSVVVLGMAFAGAGFWALAVAGLTSLTTIGIGRWWVVGWRPRARYSVAAFHGMFRYGRHLLFSKIVTRAGTRADYAIVGLRLGPELLGVFDMASMPPRLAREGMGKLLRRLLFPVFSRIHEDEGRLKRAVYKVYALSSLALWPALAGLAAVTPAFVPLYLGEQWVAAIVPMTFLSIAGMAQCISSVTGPVAEAVGRPDLLWRLGIARMPLFAGAVWLGSYWGLVGVALAVAVVTVTWSFAGAIIMLRAAGLGITLLLRATWHSLAVSAAILAGARLVLVVTRNYTDSLWIALFCAVAAGLTIGAAFLPFLWHKAEVAELRELARELIHRASDAIARRPQRMAYRSRVH